MRVTSTKNNLWIDASNWAQAQRAASLNALAGLVAEAVRLRRCAWPTTVKLTAQSEQRSTFGDEQTTENQERALREVAARSGHEIVAVYRDEGISGSKGRDKRPGFDAMHKDASRRKFDIVMAWSVDPRTASRSLSPS
jgi:Resolvase, N terminal domain